MQIRNPAHAKSPAKPWYACRWPWLLLVAQIFFVVAASGIAWRSGIRQDAFRAKTDLRDLRRDYLVARLEVQVDMRYDPATGRLHGTIHNLEPADSSEFLAAPIPPAEDRELDDATVKLSTMTHTFEPPHTKQLFIKFMHPTKADKDIKLVAEVDQYSKFSIPLPKLDAARWRVIVENGRRDWRLYGTWQWPQQQELHITADQALAPCHEKPRDC
jgi:hypothetical protein